MNKYQYKVQGVDYDVEIVDVEGNIAKVSVNGIPFEVELKEPINASKMPKRTVVTPKPAAQSAPKPAAPAAAPVATSKPATVGAGTKTVAPLPGTITEVKVNVGDTVKAGDTIVVLEAMKMQNNIEAETSGTVNSVLVKQGDTVMEGDVLITIA